MKELSNYIDEVDVERVVCGIVKQAVKDYMNATRGRGYYGCRILDDYGKVRVQKECEEFFASKWFSTLTGLNGEDFLKKLVHSKTNTRLQHKKSRRKKEENE